MCIRDRAYLNPDDDNSPIYELAQHVVLPEFGEILVTPNPKFGQPSTWRTLEEFKSAVKSGELHPLDAKLGVADGISRGLETVAKHFAEHPDLLESVNEIIQRK